MAKAETKKGPSKSELYAALAESTGLTKKQVAAVLEGLSAQAASAFKKKASDFTIPGLCKIVCIRKPATKAGMKANPFKKGEMMEVKAKPARNVVRVRALKPLKEMV